MGTGIATPPIGELLKMIQELEVGHALLQDQLYELMMPEHYIEETMSSPPPQKAEMEQGPEFTDKHYFDIMDSLGQATHILGHMSKIIYWNHSAEILYGFTKEEAIGRGVCGLIISDFNAPAAEDIIRRVQRGETWTGQFPVRHKGGELFSVVCTLTPFYDDDGVLVGAICVATDSRPLKEIIVPISGTERLQLEQTSSSSADNVTNISGLDSEQSLQTSVASKLTNLASKVSDKVRSKIKNAGVNYVIREGENGDNRHSDRNGTSNGVSSPRGEPPFGVYSSDTGKPPAKFLWDSSDDGGGKTAFHRLASKAQSWIGEKAVHWSGRGKEHEPSEHKSDRYCSPSSQGEKDDPDVKPESYAGDSDRTVGNEEPGSWSTYILNSSNGASSSGSGSGSGSGNNSVMTKLDAGSDCLDYEIMWEDLTIGEQIGQGSCGTVYHGLWYGSDVAIKVFSKQEYSEDVVLSFRQEVSLMKRLRQPNILLFMGAVTSPQRLCIVTEFLPRGSLFTLLQKSKSKLDWKRRVHMALDIARGMNYLHNCNPPIVHRDLKSSNLLVDKNWLVKVADFGLSRIKHETYLSTRTGKGTPQWMAPEVLRNERSDEKSDIYSFGIVLWELATQEIPWRELNAMQVICAVGFLNQRLEIPNDVDPRWASMIQSCWDSDPQKRPSFRELMEKLKELQRQNSALFQAARAAAIDIDQKEL